MSREPEQFRGSRHIPDRAIVLTSTQETPIDFLEYVSAYRQWFPGHLAEIEGWSNEMTKRHGDDLGVEHFVIHVAPEGAGPTGCRLSRGLRETYGIDPYPAESNKELAMGRVLENLVPGTT